MNLIDLTILLVTLPFIFLILGYFLISIGPSEGFPSAAYGMFIFGGGIIGSGVSIIASLVLTLYICSSNFPASESKDFDRLMIIFAIFTFYFALLLFSRTKGPVALVEYWKKRQFAKERWAEQIRKKNSFIRNISQKFEGYPLIIISYYGATKRFADKVCIEFVHNKNTLSQYVGQSVNKEAIKQGDIRDNISTLRAISIIISRTRAKTVYLTKGVINDNDAPKIDFADKNLWSYEHPYNETRLLIKAIKNEDTDGLNAFEYGNLVKLCKKKDSIQQKDIQKLVDYFANDLSTVLDIFINQSVTEEDVHYIFYKFTSEFREELDRGYRGDLLKAIAAHDNAGKETLAKILELMCTCLPVTRTSDGRLIRFDTGLIAFVEKRLKEMETLQ